MAAGGEDKELMLEEFEEQLWSQHPAMAPPRRRRHQLPPLARQRYVIVGGGNAAGYTARTFVEHGMANGRLCIVSKEAFPPYERSALTKGYLFPPDKKPACLPVFHTRVGSSGQRQTVEWYKENGIEVLYKDPVVAFHGKTQTLKTTSGKFLKYGSLIISTGCEASRLPKKIGGNSPGVRYIRNIADADSLVSSLGRAKKVVVIGGGYIGMEVATAACGWNLDTTIIFPEDYIMPRLFTPSLAKKYEELYQQNGVKFIKKAVSSCFGKACLLSSAVMLVLPPSCFAEPCEPEYSLPNMPLLFAIAMIGATVGGLLARQRRGELKRLNDQLRQINAALRRQAKIESYAPALSYAPVGSKIPESEVIVDPLKERLIAYLRTGKNYLRNQAPDKAFPEFKAALDLAQSLGDHLEEKKAARGLGASLERQGKYKEAIKYHAMVLNISKMTGEDSGVTEAYGAIADCYTELGELEKAGKFYDKYIARLETD